MVNVSSILTMSTNNKYNNMNDNRKMTAQQKVNLVFTILLIIFLTNVIG
jgi:hypothetical protein